MKNFEIGSMSFNQITPKSFWIKTQAVPMENKEGGRMKIDLCLGTALKMHHNSLGVMLYSTSD